VRLLSIWNVGTKHMEQNIEHPFHLSNSTGKIRRLTCAS
jgi:hypothetical protein